MRNVWRKLMVGTVLVTLTVFGLVGCGASPAAPAKPAQSPQAQAQPAATAPAAPKKDPVKIKLATSTSGLDFAPIFIAREMGYFDAEGINFELVSITGGAATTAAMKNGDVQFSANSAQDLILARQQGLAAVVIGAFPVALDWNIAAKKEWAEAKGIKPTTPIAQKIAAMKGAKMGAATVGGAPTQVARYMLRQYNLKPDVDVTFVAVGSGAARIAALKQGSVEMIIGGIPDTEQPELEGWGATLIRLGDEVPIFKDYPHEGLVVMEDYAKKNPDVVRAVAKALARGNNLIIENPAEANKALQKAFPEMKLEVLVPVMKTAQNKFGKNMLMGQPMWKNAIDVLQGAGLLKGTVDTSEGKFWTNEYLPK